MLTRRSQPFTHGEGSLTPRKSHRRSHSGSALARGGFHFDRPFPGTSPRSGRSAALGTSTEELFTRDTEFLDATLKAFSSILAREERQRQEFAVQEQARRRMNAVLLGARSAASATSSTAFIPSPLNNANSNYDRIYNALHSQSQFSAPANPKAPQTSRESSQDAALDRTLRKEIRAFMATSGNLEVVVNLSGASSSNSTGLRIPAAFARRLASSNSIAD
eukprot:RCo055777